MADRKPKRRKPRRKRRLVEPTQPNDIPFSKYRIEWCDIISDSGWATDKEFHKMKLAFLLMKAGYSLKINIMLKYLHLTTKMLTPTKLHLEIEP